VEKRDRKYRTLRLRPADKSLLQSLGGPDDEQPDRHHALLCLVSVIRELKLPDVRDEARVPLRLGIPTKLDAEIRRKADATGQTYVDILIAAANEYWQRKEGATEVRQKTTRKPSRPQN